MNYSFDADKPIKYDLRPLFEANFYCFKLTFILEIWGGGREREKEEFQKC